jgi:hypothetical protein
MGISRNHTSAAGSTAKKSSVPRWAMVLAIAMCAILSWRVGHFQHFGSPLRDEHQNGDISGRIADSWKKGQEIA